MLWIPVRPRVQIPSCRTGTVELVNVTLYRQSPSHRSACCPAIPSHVYFNPPFRSFPLHLSPFSFPHHVSVAPFPLTAHCPPQKLRLRHFKNDERRTTNDERRTTNDERRTTNDERRHNRAEYSIFGTFPRKVHCNRSAIR